MRLILIASLFFFGITMAAPAKEALAKREPVKVVTDGVSDYSELRGMTIWIQS